MACWTDCASAQEKILDEQLWKLCSIRNTNFSRMSLSGPKRIDPGKKAGAGRTAAPSAERFLLS